jgi:hypothetical protein
VFYINIYTGHGCSTYIYTRVMGVLHTYIHESWVFYIHIYTSHGCSTYIYTRVMGVLHTYIHESWVFYIHIYTSHGCSTPNQECFCFIMLTRIKFWISNQLPLNKSENDYNVCFVLNQYVELEFNSDTLLKQQFPGSCFSPLGYLISCSGQPIFVLAS